MTYWRQMDAPKERRGGCNQVYRRLSNGGRNCFCHKDPCIYTDVSTLSEAMKWRLVAIICAWHWTFILSIHWDNCGMGRQVVVGSLHMHQTTHPHICPLKTLLLRDSDLDLHKRVHASCSVEVSVAAAMMEEAWKHAGPRRGPPPSHTGVHVCCTHTISYNIIHAQLNFLRVTLFWSHDRQYDQEGTIHVLIRVFFLLPCPFAVKLYGGAQVFQSGHIVTR